MRKLWIIAMLAATGCGGSSSSSSSGPSGTIAGRSFSSAEVVAVAAGPTPCSIPGVPTTLQVSALAIGLASYTGLCGDFSSPFCTFHRSAQDVTVVLANAALVGTPVAPGTYTVNPSFTPVVGPGSLSVVGAASVGTDTACAPTTATPSSGSSIRIDSVSAATVTGHVDITFSDGGRLQGDFSAPVCAGVTPDICALAQSQGTCSTTPQCR